MNTVTVDAEKRIKMPDAKPGQVFAYELFGTVVKLTPIEQVQDRPPMFKLIQEDGYTVIETDRTVSLEVIKEVLADFP